MWSVEGVGVGQGGGGGGGGEEQKYVECAIVRKTPYECFILLSGTVQE